ncbi:hypothetical protein QL093DRAFT_2400244 [Fusarium oxysporum]|nr:hypothetical protein QL093DRAFT_2400244 [Fusarium oxysporum]
MQHCWVIPDGVCKTELPSRCSNLLFNSPTEAASTIGSLVSHLFVEKISLTSSTRAGSMSETRLQKRHFHVITVA